MDFEAIIYYIGYLYPLVLLIGILSAIDVILKGRTAQGTIAWAICLVIFPFLTVPFYMIFGGRKFHGYVKTHRKDKQTLEDIRTSLLTSLQKFTCMSEGKPEFALTKLAKMPITGGHKTDLLTNGEDKFEAVYQELENVQNYILVQYYIIRHDQTGKRFKEALIKKAREGIKVYFLYDAIGSYELSNRYLKELRRAGVQVAQFGNYRFVKNKFQLNFRNHRKIIILDGKMAFCGGMNVGDEYMGLHKNFSPWRDTHLKIQGPAVQCIQLTFLEDWHCMEGYYPEGLQWQPQSAGDSKLLVLPTGPADELDICSQAFVNICNAAYDRLWISSPYFVPSPEAASALQAAAVRGVDVRVIIPQKADNTMVQLSSQCFIDTVCKYGVKFYRLKKGFLHQKAILVDNSMAAVGTVNLDNRSFSLNFELMVYGFDKNFIKDLDQILVKDLRDSELIPEGEFNKKPFYLQLLARICRLLSPLQ